MKRLPAAALAFALFCAPAFAKNFAVPSDDPAATIALPDGWTLTDIDYGYSAVSPDKDVFFSVEYAGGKAIDAMTALNDSWLKENNIKLKGEAQKPRTPSTASMPISCSSMRPTTTARPKSPSASSRRARAASSC